ncbi:hypothetical protein R1sor_027212 [Riccia sorocarpa]|uniref:Uncharacterized protein n=1 Tax=Riccia sorocarpa TaxID=122646 RepID=A0ABD3GFP8_9MARC
MYAFEYRTSKVESVKDNASTTAHEMAVGDIHPSMDAREFVSRLESLFLQDEDEKSSSEEWSVGEVSGEDNWEVPEEDRVTEIEEAPSFDLPEEADLEEWGVLKTHQVSLSRDLSVTDRIVYRTDIYPLEQDEVGINEVLVSKLWTGDRAPAHVDFGKLLASEGGLFRAGIEVGEGGWRARDIVLGTTTSSLRPNLFA